MASREAALRLPFILSVPAAHEPSAGALADVQASKVAVNRLSSSEDKRRKRMCKVDGCTKYLVHRGLCCKHGGGKKCAHDGCNTSAKHKGLCWKHGGSVLCKMNKCTRKAKARGLCWSHGGGTKCRQEECAKVAVSNGFCWAHGGGKRCGFEGCIKPGYERTASLCPQHYEQLSKQYDGQERQLRCEDDEVAYFEL